MVSLDLLDEGTLTFSIASRIIRELGERLVKQPEVAFVELIKNSYDADATVCRVTHNSQQSIEVIDDGHGMTLAEFQAGWMRIGTNVKESTQLSRAFRRVITGEKGIGRFAVRFLGTTLDLESIADDPDRSVRTLLTAHFDWPDFDQTEDLGRVQVPYRLSRSGDSPTGTTLRVSALRHAVQSVSLYAVRTASISVVTPYAPLLRPSTYSKHATPVGGPGARERSGVHIRDPSPGRRHHGRHGRSERCPLQCRPASRRRVGR